MSSLDVLLDEDGVPALLPFLTAPDLAQLLGVRRWGERAEERAWSAVLRAAVPEVCEQPHAVRLRHSPTHCTTVDRRLLAHHAQRSRWLLRMVHAVRQIRSNGDL